MPSIDQNWQPFTGNEDVCTLVNNSRVGRLTSKQPKTLKPIFPEFEYPPGNSRLLHIIYSSTKMADGADDSIDTEISRLNGKFSSELHYDSPPD